MMQGHKIRMESATTRVVAACCNSAMFLNFEKGHWFSVPSDVPSYSSFPFRFVAKLVAARIAMPLHR